MLRFKFHQEKAIASVLYLATSLQSKGIKKIGFHKIFKLLYFAEKKHLVKYGRPITGDFFVAMDYGPVPSAIYDMLKSVKGDSPLIAAATFSEYFHVVSHFITPKQQPDLDEFSESDLECLAASIEENFLLNFDQLVKKSHDAAYDKADHVSKISFREMAKSAGADPEMLKYLKIVSENENFSEHDCSR